MVGRDLILVRQRCGRVALGWRDLARAIRGRARDSRPRARCARDSRPSGAICDITGKRGKTSFLMDFRSAAHFSRIRDSGREFAIFARFATFRATFAIPRLDGPVVSILGVSTCQPPSQGPQHPDPRNGQTRKQNCRKSSCALCGDKSPLRLFLFRAANPIPTPVTPKSVCFTGTGENQSRWQSDIKPQHKPRATDIPCLRSL